MSNESTPKKDVGITVDMTMIPACLLTQSLLIKEISSVGTNTSALRWNNTGEGERELGDDQRWEMKLVEPILM